MDDKQPPGDAGTHHAGASANPFDPAFAGAFKASAQQIWLAGMGAFAKAQEEGAKVFETLVKEGATLQRKTQTVAEERFGDVAEKMSALAGEVSQKAGTSWDKLENIFEDRTAKALKRLGIPTAEDLRAVNDRLDMLTAAVAALREAEAAGRTDAAAAEAAAAPMRRARKAAAPSDDT